jgi:Leucine-rich repeat (LRR) protein
LIYADNNNLTEFNALLFNSKVKWRDLVTLNLSNNKIKSIEFASVELKELRTMILSKNLITTVDLGNCHFPELVVLNLSIIFINVA